MSELSRHLKKKTLAAFFEQARGALLAPQDFLQLSDQQGKELARCGEPRAGMECIALPLTLEGQPVGELRGCLQHSPNHLEFLCFSLQTLLDAEHARRSVSEETLDQYRELALLHRAAVSLNASLDPREVAQSLLELLQEGEEAFAVGACYAASAEDADGLLPLAALGAYGGDFDALAACDLISAILRSGKPEIINSLTHDPRWGGGPTACEHLLAAPITASDAVIGLLLLGKPAAAEEFHASDLKRAATLASMAAGALRNARLFEEVMEVKNYNESLLRSLSNGVIALNREMLVNKANRAACQILGLSEKQIIGRPLVQLLAPESAWAADWVQRVFVQGEPQVRLDCMLQTPGGQPVHLNLTSEPLSDANEQPIGVMLVMEDITREKRIKHTMGRYMTDKVMERLLEGDDSVLGGKEQPVSILFSDIRRFTGFVERLAPGEAVAQLNEYLSGMVDIVFDQGGTLDKFIGDAVMALFGAPFVSASDADHAVDAAVEMQRWLTSLNQRRQAKGQGPFNIGIGINTGPVIVGNIGSPKRMDFTVIGDHVNLAARLESANKFYGSKILISEYTQASLTRPHAMREIDKVRVMGRSQPVRIYELLDYHSESTFPNLEFVLQRFTQGVEDFRARRFDAAAKAFGDVVKVKPNDKPSVIYLQRCLEYSEHEPPEGWSGVVDLGSK